MALGIPFTYVRVLLGSVLLLAAALKASRPPESQYTLLIVAWEAALGAWLLLGHHPRVSRIVALLTFVCFLGVASYATLRGEDCGCFGAASVAPTYILALDLTAVTCLLLSRVVIRPVRRRVVCVQWLSVAIVCLSVATVSSFQVSALPRPVIVEPHSWAGRELPVLKDIVTSANLKSGEWSAIFYRRNCRHCQTVLKNLARRELAASPRERYVLIEVPETTESAEPRIPAGRWQHGKLASDRLWVIETPLQVTLVDGVVQRVALPGRETH